MPWYRTQNVYRFFRFIVNIGCVQRNSHCSCYQERQRKPEIDFIYEWWHRPENKLKPFQIIESWNTWTKPNLLYTSNDLYAYKKQIVCECYKSDHWNGVINRIDQMNDPTILHATQDPILVGCILWNNINLPENLRTTFRVEFSVCLTWPLTRLKSVLSCLNCAAKPTLTIITKRSMNDHANVTTTLNHLLRIAFHHVSSVMTNKNGTWISNSSCNGFFGGTALIAFTMMDTIFNECSTVQNEVKVKLKFKWMKLNWIVLMQNKTSQFNCSSVPKATDRTMVDIVRIFRPSRFFSAFVV